MSFIRQFKCDSCTCHVDAYFNGEHWLPPEGWIQLYDPHTANTIDVHYCSRCFKKASDHKQKKEKSKC